MEWRAYYTDGRRFNSREHKPDELPGDGVLGIVQYLDRRTEAGQPYRSILSGYDHYFWWRGEWFGNSDPEAEIARRYPGALILRGQWTPTGEMDGAQAEMAADKEAP